MDEFVADFDADGAASAGAFRRAILTTGYKGFCLDKWIRRNLARLSRDCEHDGIRWAGMPYWAEDPRMLKLVRLIGLPVDEELAVDGECVIFNVDIAAVALFQCSVLFANWESVVHSSQVKWHNEEYEDAWTEIGVQSVATYTYRLVIDLDRAKVKKSWLTHTTCRKPWPSCARLRWNTRINAGFPAVRTLESLDHEAQPAVDPKQILQLAASRWVAHGDTVLFQLRKTTWPRPKAKDAWKSA